MCTFRARVYAFLFLSRFDLNKKKSDLALHRFLREARDDEALFFAVRVVPFFQKTTFFRG